MTAVSRLLRSRALVSAATRTRVAAARVPAVPRALSTAAVVRPRVSVSTVAANAVRTYAAAAAQEAETTAEQVWPERVLPTLSETDLARLTRQRNIGM
jgi:hypothetical protein